MSIKVPGCQDLKVLGFKGDKGNKGNKGNKGAKVKRSSQGQVLRLKVFSGTGC